MSSGGDTLPRGLLLLTPLAMERLALRGRSASTHIVRTGMGPGRARGAANRLTSSPAHGDVAAVAVAGFGGALDPSLRPGDVVVATEVRGPEGPLPCPSAGIVVAALRRAGVPARLGPIVSTDHIVSGDERPRLAARGALAVDMESAWLFPAAAGRPMAVVRAVVDGPGRDLNRRPLASARGAMAAARSLRRALPALESWAAAAADRTVLLAGPRSFCAGVERAIEIVERALDRYGPPVFVRKQIVHNVHVVRDLEARGAVFVDDLDDVPLGEVTVFSAHGVSPAVRERAAARHLRVIDATCPLVTKVHTEARRFARAGYTIVLVGHDGHEEVEGTSGEAPERIRLIERAEDVRGLELAGDEPVAYLTQTTLAVDEVDEVVRELRARFPGLAGPGSDDICYATSNRQEAVKSLAREADLVLVIGSGNSSNSRRLVEVAERESRAAHLIDDETDVDPAWLAEARTVGLTAGASAPEFLVDRVIGALRGLGRVRVQERRVIEESVQFTMPAELRGGPRDEER